MSRPNAPGADRRARMTEPQRALVEENAGLLWNALRLLHRRHLVCRLHPDAAWDGAVQGLLACARTWDPERAKFSTYAARGMVLSGLREAARAAARAVRRREADLVWSGAAAPDWRADADRVDLRLDATELLEAVRARRPSAARAIEGLLAGSSLRDVDRAAGNGHNASWMALSDLRKKLERGAGR